MKPVPQTDFGYGTGNCFSACIASILEMSIEDVPNFCHQDHGEGETTWLERTAAWLKERGYGMVVFGWKLEPSPLCTPGSHVIACGRSPRAETDDEDFMHAVIWTPVTGRRYEAVEADGRKVWKLDGYGYEWTYDPHPSGAFLDGDPVDLIMITR